MNPVEQKLRAAGFRFSKKTWPLVSRMDLELAGISSEEWWSNVRGSTLSETMGPNWKLGVRFSFNGKLGQWRPYTLK